MFDFLKKKITGFVDKLTRKEESKEVEEKAEEKIEEIVEEKVEEKPVEEIKTPEAEKPIEEKAEPEIPKPKELKPEKQVSKIDIPAVKEEKPKEKAKKVELPKEAKPPPKPKKEAPIPKKEAEKPEEEKPLKQVSKFDSEAVKPKKGKPEAPKEEKPEEKAKKVELPKEAKPPPKPKKEAPIPKIKEEKKEGKPETPKPETVHPKPETPKPETKAELPEYKEEKKKGISLSPLKAIKSFITQEVEISESDVHELLENLELELLEADVELGVAEAIRQELQSKLVGSKVKKKELDKFIKNIMRNTLVDMMSSEKAFDLIEYMERSEKPVKLVFLGLNGTGKTTSIAKIAHLLLQNNYKVVFAAADTFRAAAIEQMEIHANRLNVKIIKRDYGADPTSVGYDAVSYAKAHGIDAVLIDTAGRQDTNINLINELKKMDRVIKPDLKLYIGESIAGSSVIEQISTFNEHIGIDGVILTKLDCDPKGGTILSITKATGIPVIYIGTGQKYADLERFEPEKIIDRILASN